ncbi:MAG: BLUF domain-containing protein [Gammaproteobacteria bacterium]|nr:BLUF domain-containing protein [Gammaproteobacteria bacterium]
MEHILIYTSESTEDHKRQVLDNIINVSAKLNAEKNITGILLYDTKNFLQILEGDEFQINALLGKIKKDNRHTNIRIVISEKLKSRNFKNWSMRVKLIETNALTEIHKWAIQSGQNLWGKEHDDVLKLILILILEVFPEASEFSKDQTILDYDSLTRREREILLFLVKGFTAKNIANQLNISEKTVARHAENIRNKWGCASKSEIISAIFDSGYVYKLL